MSNEQTPYDVILEQTGVSIEELRSPVIVTWEDVRQTPGLQDLLTKMLQVRTKVTLTLPIKLHKPQ